MNRIYLLNTVGISSYRHLTAAARSQYQKEAEFLQRYIDGIDECVANDKLQACDRDFLCNLAELFQAPKAEALKNLLSGEQTPLPEDFFMAKSFPSAESQTALGWIWKNRAGGDRREISVRLYPTEDLRSRFTAQVTRLCLWGASIRNELDPIDIGAGGDCVSSIDIEPETYDRLIPGIENLFKAFDGIREKAFDDGDEVILNVVGSYKPVTAYALLYAQVYGISSIYSPEGSSEGGFELRPLPLGYAINVLDEEISMLRGLRDNPALLSDENVMRGLPGWVKGLFIKKDGVFVPFYLVTKLIELFDSSGFTTTGLGRGILCRLQAHNRAVHRYIESRIGKEWAYLWIGDQIPETVEHNRRHSKRLMEAAANVFRAAEGELRRLGMDAYFPIALLISSIYLHDIGHTLVSYPPLEKIEGEPDEGVFPLDMFPSAVREVHHLLSRDLIRILAEQLFPEDPENGLPGNLLLKLRKVVPLICAYHRKHLLLREGRAEATASIRDVGTFLYGREEFEESLTALKDALDGIEGLELTEDEKERVLRVTALLRIIDECDVQVDRAGARGYLEARLKRNLVEIRSLNHQFVRFRKLMENWRPQKEKAREICRLVEAVSGRISGIDTERIAVEGLPDPVLAEIAADVKKLYPLIFQALGELRGEGSFNDLTDTAESVNLMLALSLANRIAFKCEQFKHFYTHNAVAFVLPVASGDGGVTILLNTAGNRPGDRGKYCQGIVGDIREEIENCRDVLPGLKIRVEMKP